MIEKRIVDHQEWQAARRRHLQHERDLTHARDSLRKERMSLPMVKVSKAYHFDTMDGSVSLSQLFGANSQLIVQHIMFGDDRQVCCKGCSLQADHINGALPHLLHHDVSFAAIARGKADKLEAYRRRSGWLFPFVSSGASSFNYDFGVTFTPAEIETGAGEYNYGVGTADAQDLSGMSCFYRNEVGEIYHTYSSYARGNEEVITTYMILDIAPKGRNEASPMDWVKRSYEYDHDN